MSLIAKIIALLKKAGIDYSKMAGKVDPNKISQLITKTQKTATKPKLIDALNKDKATFNDAIDIFENDAKYLSQMNEMEQVNFANNLEDYFTVGGKVKYVPSNVVTKEGTPVVGKQLEKLSERKGIKGPTDETTLSGAMEGLMSLVDDLKGISPKMRKSMDRDELAKFIQKMRGRKFTNEEVKLVREYADEYSIGLAKEKAAPAMVHAKKLGAKTKDEFEFVREYLDNIQTTSPEKFREMYGSVKNINMDINTAIENKLEKHFRKKYKWDKTKTDGGLDDVTFDKYEDELYEAQKEFGDFHTVYDTDSPPGVFGMRKSTSWVNHPKNYLDDASEKLQEITGEGLNVDFYKKYTDEVLTKYPKPEKFQYGGVAGLLGERTGYFTGALADTAEGKAMSPGTRADYSPGQGHRETYGAPPGITTTPTHIPKPPKDPNQIIQQNLATGKMMTRADLLAKKRFEDYVNLKRYYSMGEDDEGDELYDAYRTAIGSDEHMKNALVSSDLTHQAKQIDGKMKFNNWIGHNTLKDLDKDWTTRSTIVQDTAGNISTNRLTPTGMWENGVYLGHRAPQSLAIDTSYAGGGLAGMLGEPTYADGGRIGFKKGTKFDPKRRTVLKGIAALASIPFIGKYFKWAKPLAKSSKVLAQVPIKVGVDGMPVWFPKLVNKVIKEGDDVSKRFATQERQIVHQSTLPDSKTDVIVTQDLSTGDVAVDIGMGKHGWTDGKFGQPVRLEYKASEVIEPTIGKKGKIESKGTQTKEEFWVEEAEFTGGHPENVKFEESSFEKFGKHESDFREVEKFATGKNTVTGQFGTDKAAYERKISNYPEPDDFASGGRVPLSKGKIVEGLAWLANKIAPGSTKIGQTSKTMADKTQLKQSIARFLENEKVAKELESLRGQVDDNIIKEISAMEPAQQLKAIEDVKLYLRNMKNLRQETTLREFDVTGREPHALGGLAGMLGE